MCCVDRLKRNFKNECDPVELSGNRRVAVHVKTVLTFYVPGDVEVDGGAQWKFCELVPLDDEDDND